MSSVFFSNAQRIIAQIFEWLQSSAQTRIANLITDSFTSGIDKSTDAGEGFLVVPGTNNTSAAPTVNVTLGGIAYDPLGNRIFISSTDTTLYNEANVTETTNDGLGNQILTPQSSGVINIPVTQNSTNYIWIDYLATTNTAAFTLNEITNAKIFYEITDGYNIRVTTTNVAPDVNSIFLASVTTTGTAVISGNISQLGRTYYTILAGLIPLTNVLPGTQYQLAYYASTGAVVTGNPNVMSPSEALVTDAQGVPTTSGNGGTTVTEIGYVHGVTSPIQAQLNTKFDTAGAGLTSTGTTVSVVAGTTVPTGSLLPFAGSAAPTGFLIADGSSYSTGTYPNLFSVIGYTYGGSGGNFNVPNMLGYVPAGLGGSLGLGLGNTTGATTASDTVTPTQNPHQHVGTTGSLSGAAFGPQATGWPFGYSTVTIGNAGWAATAGGVSPYEFANTSETTATTNPVTVTVSTVQQTIGVNYIIKF